MLILLAETPRPLLFIPLLSFLDFLQPLLQLRTLDLRQARIAKALRQLVNHEAMDLLNAFLKLANFRCEVGI